MERTPQKFLRCGSEDHMIAECPKPPKDNEKCQKKVSFNENGNCACDNRKNNDDQQIYASMARMSSNNERSSEKYGDSFQLTNWILDSVATCHMTPEVSDFIPGSLEYTDKYIEVADGHHVTAKQKRSSTNVQQTNGTYASECFRCGSEDHMIAKYPKPPKDNEKRRKQVRFNEKS